MENGDKDGLTKRKLIDKHFWEQIINLDFVSTERSCQDHTEENFGNQRKKKPVDNLDLKTFGYYQSTSGNTEENSIKRALEEITNDPISKQKQPTKQTI